MLTNDQNLIFQSYFTTSLLTELTNNNLLDSDYFQKMKFGSPFIKDSLKKDIGIDNQGSLLIFLYVLLVIPKELIFEEFKNDYENIDKELNTKYKETTRTTYKTDLTDIKYLRHIRNALAHARVIFKNDHVIFIDKNKNNEFEFSLPLVDIGDFLMKLQEIHIKYIKKLQEK